MSLNYKEIDLVLSELDILGCQIQRIVQPAYDTLVLSLYKPRSSFDLLICLAHGACRLHATTFSAPKREKPLRFAELLKSRIRNGRVEAVRQLGAERIVRFDIKVANEETEYVRYRLYARLWSGASNLILTDEAGTIIDALARKPKRGEMTGGVYCPEESLPDGIPAKEFHVRDIPGEGSFNERVDALYAQGQGELSREKLLEKAREWFARRRSTLELRLTEIERTETEYEDSERLKELGDILMSKAGSSAPTDKFLEAEDFYRGGVARIQVSPGTSIVENARAYYERYRKATSGLQDVRTELIEIRKRLENLEKEQTALEAQESPYAIRAFLERRRTKAIAAKQSYPGISLERDGWILLVGRSAKENDELLRKHVRGNDLWLHARDRPGAYVFIKNRPGKSVPLDVLLDAGALALYYSKERASGQGDLYYTHVKYLRRAKDGPKGLVLPTQEKNLHVRLDSDRLRFLRSLIGKEEEKS